MVNFPLCRLWASRVENTPTASIVLQPEGTNKCIRSESQGTEIRL